MQIIQKYLLPEKIDALKAQWVSTCKLLQVQLKALIEGYFARVNENDQEKKVISKLYKELQKIDSYLNDFNKEEIVNLGSALHKFLLFIVNERFCTRAALENYSIEGILYNAVILHAQLHPLNILDDQQELTSFISRAPLARGNALDDKKRLNIALSNRVYESLPLFTSSISFKYDRGADKAYAVINYAPESMLPQDHLRILWLLKENGISLLKKAKKLLEKHIKELLIQDNKKLRLTGDQHEALLAYQRLIAEGVDSVDFLINPNDGDYAVFLTDKKNIPYSDRYFSGSGQWRRRIQYFSYQYLSFYNQLIYKSYSFYAIAGFSDFLLSNTMTDESFGENRQILLQVPPSTRSNPSNCYYSFGKWAEIYAIAKATGYSLSAPNAQEMALRCEERASKNLIKPCDAISSLFKEHLLPIDSELATNSAPKQPIIEDTVGWITQSDIKAQKKEHTDQLIDQLQKIVERWPSDPTGLSKLDRLLCRAIQPFLEKKTELAASHYSRLYNLLKHKAQTLNSMDAAKTGVSLQGVICNTLMTLSVCCPRNALESFPVNLSDLSDTKKEAFYQKLPTRKLRDPVMEKPIPWEKTIVLEGYYFHQDAFLKIFDKKLAGVDTYSKRLRFTRSRLDAAYPALHYQSITFHTEGFVTYFPWRSVISLVKQLGEEPAVPLALYPYSAPMDEKDKPPKPHLFIMAKDEKQKWKRVIKDSSVTYLSYEEIDTYMDAIQQSRSLKEIIVSTQLSDIASNLSPLYQTLSTLEKYFGLSIEDRVMQENIKAIHATIQQAIDQIQKILEKGLKWYSNDQRIKDQETLQKNIHDLHASAEAMFCDKSVFSLCCLSTQKRKEALPFYKGVSFGEALYGVLMDCIRLYSQNRDLLDHLSIQTPSEDYELPLGDGCLYHLDTLNEKLINIKPECLLDSLDVNYIDIKAGFKSEISQQSILPSHAVFGLLHQLKIHCQEKSFKNSVLLTSPKHLYDPGKKTVFIVPEKIVSQSEAMLREQYNIHLLFGNRLSLYDQLASCGFALSDIVAIDEQLNLSRFQSKEIASLKLTVLLDAASNRSLAFLKEAYVSKIQGKKSSKQQPSIGNKTNEDGAQYQKRLDRLLERSRIREFLEEKRWNTLGGLEAVVGKAKISQALSNLEVFYDVSKEKKRPSSDDVKQADALRRAVTDKLGINILSIETEQCRWFVLKNRQFKVWLEEIKKSSKLSSRKRLLQKLNKSHELKTIVDLAQTSSSFGPHDSLAIIRAAIGILEHSSKCKHEASKDFSWSSTVKKQIALNTSEPLVQSQQQHALDAQQKTAKQLHHEPPKPAFFRSIGSLFQEHSQDKKHTGSNTDSKGPEKSHSSQHRPRHK